MRVLVLAGYYLPGFKGGGPVKTVKNLIESKISDFVHFTVVTGDRDLGDKSSYKSVRIGEWNRMENVEVFYSRRGLKGLFQIAQIVLKEDYDIIYLNSFFSFKYAIFPQVILRLFRSKKVILAPRGELSTGALSLKAFKKRIFVTFYLLLGLHRRVIYQASSTFEREEIENVLGLKIDVRVAENIAAHQFFHLDSFLQDKNIRLVFVSRITPKKNLVYALSVLSKIKFKAYFDIFGPIEDVDYWNECLVLIDKMPSNVVVSYMGTLEPTNVINTIGHYDMFFLPTLGENFGHAISEAFCAGLPVLTSDTTPWRNLESRGLGWDIPLDNKDKFVSILNEYSLTRDESYIAKREYVLNWARAKFSGQESVESNLNLFRYAFNKSKDLENDF